MLGNVQLVCKDNFAKLKIHTQNLQIRAMEIFVGAYGPENWHLSLNREKSKQKASLPAF